MISTNQDKIPQFFLKSHFESFLFKIDAYLVFSAGLIRKLITLIFSHLFLAVLI